MLSFSSYASLPAAPDSLPRISRTPQLKTIAVEGGMRLQVMEISDCPVFEARLVVRPPLGEIFPAPTAAILASIADQGTRKRTREQLHEHLARCGLHLDCESEDTQIMFKMSGSSEHASQGVEMLADIVTGLSIMPASFEERMIQLQAGIRPYPTNPLRVLDRAVKLSDEHVLRIPDIESERASLSSLRREDLISFHRAGFRPQNVTLTVAGDISAGAMKSAARKNFHSWPYSASQLPPVRLCAGKIDERILWYPTGTNRSAYGAVILSGGAVPAVGFAELLKDFLVQESKAGNDLVSKLSLSFLQVKSVEHASEDAVAVMFVCPADQTLVVIKALLETLDKRATAPVSDSELQRVQRALIGRTMVELSSVSGTTDLLVSDAGDPLSPFKQLEQVEKLTSAIFTANLAIFSLANCKLLLFADSAAISTQLDSIRSLIRL
jgi:predicted Zn-dependent peptidase